MLNNELPTTFYITEVRPAGVGQTLDHVVVRHRHGAANGRHLGRAQGYHKALVMVHLFAKAGDTCVVVPLNGERREFVLATRPAMPEPGQVPEPAQVMEAVTQ